MSCTCIPQAVNGYEWIQWIGFLFGDCIYTPADQISFYAALLGIIFAFIAMLPQFYTNYTLKSRFIFPINKSDGLSMGLVLFWTMGDFVSLLGSWLTLQLPTQTITALSFFAMDLAMCCQCFYYKRVYPGFGYTRLDQDLIENGADQDQENVQEIDIEDNTGISSPTTSNIAQAVLAAAIPGVAAILNISEPILCNQSPKLSESLEYLGYVLAWIAGLLYFISRIPQVIKNYKDKSVHGLSLYLFMLTILSNLLYGISVFLRMPPINIKFYLGTFPYLIGSLGTVLLDFVTLYQAYLYGGLPSL